MQCNDSLKFWKGKKVLLTGHTGFKGTWMSLMLNSLGAEVCGYSLPLNPCSFYNKAKVKVTKHCEGDISDRAALERAFEEFKPSIIIHLASHSSLDGSDRIPDFILRTNIMGVVNLLDISRNVDYVKSIVIVTSDKCYRNMESEKPYKEDCDLGGEEPYSVSKVCQELITKCYQKTFFEKACSHTGRLCIATARASNVIGVGDYNVTRLIPYLLECFKDGNVATIRNPKSIRPWQYVQDVIWGYLLLAEKLYEESQIGFQYNGSYNFGPKEDGFREVGEIAKIFSERFLNAKYVFGDVNRSIKKETNILKLDSTKAQSILKWQPLYTIEDIADEIALFTKQENCGVEVDRLCEDAVYVYLKKVMKRYE